MKIKLYLALLSIISLSSLQVVAQTALNKRAMGAIGNTPKAGDFLNGASLDNVDMTTGTLKIGIPLYEVKVNDITVPIMLNYSALGLKVNQEAGLAGMGWELSAGGKIITTVNGKADAGDLNVRGKKDLLLNAQSSNYEVFSYPFTYNQASPSFEEKKRIHNFVDGKWDNAWDVYTYVLPNKSGSYVTDYSSSTITFPYDPMVKVKHFNHLQPAVNTITTDGLEYSFGAGDIRQTSKINAYEMANGGLVTRTSPLKQAEPEWVDYNLMSIKSTRFNDVVTFQYDAFFESMNNNPIAGKTRTNVTESLPIYKDFTGTYLNNTWPPATPILTEFELREPMLSKTETRYKTYTRIKEINFPNGKVTFDYSDFDPRGRDVLSNIKVYRKDGDTFKMIKRFAFYYNDSYYTYARYLQNIGIFDGNNQPQGNWVFQYKSGPMPVASNVESKAQDRWGFYNGAIGNLTLLENPSTVPAFKALGLTNASLGALGPLKYTREDNKDYYGRTTPWNSATDDFWQFGPAGSIYVVNFANRDFNFQNAVKGTLNYIKTPTGATYEYEYEGHKISWHDNANLADGGGIRIKSITKNLGHNNLYYGVSTSERTVIKTYLYGHSTENIAQNNPDAASGMGVYLTPRNVLTNTAVYYHNSGGGYQFKKLGNFIQLSHPIGNSTIHNGSYVMYGCVTEYLHQLGAVSGTYPNINYTHGKTVYFNNGPRFDLTLKNVSGGYGYDPQNGFKLPYAGTLNPHDPDYVERYYSVDPGISAETGADTYAIHKYAYRDDLPESSRYRLVERLGYEYKFYKNPETSSVFNNVFIAVTGQIVGEYTEAGKITPPPIETPPDNDKRKRGLSALVWEGTNGVTGGSMNYYTASFTLDEDRLPYYEGKYHFTNYNLIDFSFCKKLIREEKTEYTLGDKMTTDQYDHDLPAGSFLKTIYDYGNPYHMMPTLIYKAPGVQKATHRYYDLQDSVWRDQNLPPKLTEYSKTRLLYAQDINDTLGVPVNDLPAMQSTMSGLDQPLAEFNYTLKQGVDHEVLASGTINTVKPNYYGGVVPEKTFTFNLTDNHTGSIPSVVNVWTGNLVANPNPTYLKEKVSYDGYYKGQVHVYTEPTGQSTTVLWGYNNQLPIAKVTNSGNNLLTYQPGGTLNAKVAYTSFESKDTCNWVYSFNGVKLDTTSISGKQVFELGTYAITKQNTSVSGTHILSYWYKAGSAISVSGAATVGAEVIKNTLGPWIYAERTISNINATLTISGTLGSRIDEVRLYPADAQVTSFLHDPLVGLIGIIDNNGRPQYFEYDDMQRLIKTKDQDGNTVKAYKYILGTEN